jgi:hypothetical protein
VLHPDETHDGGAGDDTGLSYRMLYVDPALIARALDEGAAPPFVAEPVIDDAPLGAVLAEALGALDVRLSPDELAAIERAIPKGAAAGARYAAPAMAHLDSER